MQDQAQLGMIVGIGVLALIILVVAIVVPRQLRKGRERAQQAVQAHDNMATDLGLTKTANGLEGNYKGYQVRLEKGMGSNKAAVNDAEQSLISNLFFDDDEDEPWEDLHSNTTVFPTVKVWLTAPGANFPDVTFFQSSNFFLSTDEYRNNRLNGRIPDEQKLDIDGDDLHKRGNFYGDSNGAQKMLASAELRRLMSSWAYPDVRAEGTGVQLELNNSNIIAKWGHKKTSGTEYLVQAIDICVATADALK